MVDMVLSMGALVIVMLVTGAKFYWTFLLFPVVVLQMYIFCCGLGFLLATVNVFFRDIVYIYNAITTALSVGKTSGKYAVPYKRI